MVKGVGRVEIWVGVLALPPVYYLASLVFISLPKKFPGGSNETRSLNSPVN
jgi:hypothetical protein